MEDKYKNSSLMLSEGQTDLLLDYVIDRMESKEFVERVRESLLKEWKENKYLLTTLWEIFLNDKSKKEMSDEWGIQKSFKE